VAVDLEPEEDAETAERVDDRVFLLFEGSEALLEFFPEALDSANYILYQ
jgi:hypothetical protein